MNGVERKMIELSNNSQLTRSCANMLSLNLSEQQLQQLERWMDHAIRENEQQAKNAERRAWRNCGRI